MSSSSKRLRGSRLRAKSATTWYWRRLILPDEHDFWTGRLEAEKVPWVLTERVGRMRAVLTAYPGTRTEAAALVRKLGGRVESIGQDKWLKPLNVAPIRIGSRLEIVPEAPQGKKKSAVPRLFIPHGIAFGSGEHATTRMLLQALARRGEWERTTMLDLGTGSGILALAARSFGARKITATDIETDAIRTARENEANNFPDSLVRWRCADVRRLKAPGGGYDLVVANLFSGILTEMAEAIARCVKPEGELWLSGVLRSQQAEVIAAYRRHGIKLDRAVSRGKWVMIQFTKPRAPRG